MVETKGDLELLKVNTLLEVVLWHATLIARISDSKPYLTTNQDILQEFFQALLIGLCSSRFFFFF